MVINIINSCSLIFHKFFSLSLSLFFPCYFFACLFACACVQNTDTIESHSPQLTKYWQQPPSACNRNNGGGNGGYYPGGGKQNTDHHHSHHHTTITHDSKSVYVTEMANNGIKTAGVRKNTAAGGNDDTEAESMSLNGSSIISGHHSYYILFMMTITTFVIRLVT